MNDPADAIKARARARIGQVLREKWRIDGMLGVGGMAVVYAATHMKNSRRVAIKLLHPELAANQEVKSRFLREGYVANNVQHPGTVGVLDDDVTEDGGVFLVMELLEGETLEARRERSGKLPAHEVVSLADRLLDVLAAAHDKGIVHRDIKPENIFLTREGSVKVLDFGIARMRELQSARLTLTNVGAIGTPAFMPPEQARGKWDDVGPRSDIWAVGATMFTLMAGRLVHQAATLQDLMVHAMTKPAPPIASVVPMLPGPVANAIDRALAFELKARWPDARAMQAALRAAYPSFEQAMSMSGAFKAWTPQAAAQAQAPAPASSQHPGLRADEPRYAPGPPAVIPVAIPPAAMAVAAGPMPMHPMGAPGSTAQPVMMGAAPPPSKKGFPVLPVVGGLVGASAVGAVVVLLATRAGGPPPIVSASAMASVSAAPAAVASAEPPASASAEPSAAPSTSASAVPPDASGSAAVPAPSATATTTATAATRPTKPPRSGPRHRFFDRHK